MRQTQVNRKRKTPAMSYCESRKIAMPEDINPHGTLFGGVLLTWMDKIGYMCAQLYAEWKLTVTASMDRIDFLTPIEVGDHVVLGARVVATGTSSIEIDIEAFKINPVFPGRKLAATAHMTFIALMPDGLKYAVPELFPENSEDFERHKNALKRRKYRGEFC
jgi:acyl-CoA hydrolase